MPEIATTIYGDVDGQVLRSLQESFDSRDLLHAVDPLDGIRARCGSDGLRDDLLRLHGMAHTVINGASLPHDADGPTLVEQVEAALWELDDWIVTLERMRNALLPLERLHPHGK